MNIVEMSCVVENTRTVHTATTALRPQPRQSPLILCILCVAFCPMAAGVALSEDLRGIVIRMHILRGLSPKSISYFTCIPLRTVQHVLTVWKRTGEAKPTSEVIQGRPRVLDFADTQVRHHLLSTSTKLSQIYILSVLSD